MIILPLGSERARPFVEPPFDIFQQLKEHTADIHKRVEGRIPIFQPDFKISDYVSLVERFYGFWRPLETKLSLSKALEHPKLDLSGRMKSSLLEMDLRTLGRDPLRALRCDAVPDVDSFNRGIGCLYVLEGSTLGARIISKHLEKDLQLTPRSGAAFFNAYGNSVGERWSEFKHFVTPRADISSAEEILLAATETFQSLLNWL